MDDTVLFKQRPAQNPQNFSDPQRSTPPTLPAPLHGMGGLRVAILELHAFAFHLTHGDTFPKVEDQHGQ